MAASKLPEAETLRKLLDYDPETGFLTWKPRPEDRRWTTKNAGKRAFTARKESCHHGSVYGRNYKAHRIIWKLVHGVDPEVIDHVNGDGFDNRLSNLRSVPQKQNMLNLKRYGTNSSGQCGVYFNRARGKWQAYITIDGRTRYLGIFASKSAAISARKDAEIRLGFHPNHGR